MCALGKLQCFGRRKTSVCTERLDLGKSGQDESRSFAGTTGGSCSELTQTEGTSSHYNNTSSTASKNPASDDHSVNQKSLRRNSPIFRSYEEELEHRLEHDPSPTESDLLQDLENEFDDELIHKYNLERICFLERSASFNSDRCGQQGAFVRYPNPNKPKRSSSFCSGSAGSGGKNSSRLRPSDHHLDKKVNGEEIKRSRKLWRCKSVEGQIETTSESEDCLEVRARKRFSDAKKREKRKIKKEKKSPEKGKPAETKEQTPTTGRKLIIAPAGTKPITGENVSLCNNISERNSKEVVAPKPALRNKIAPVPPKRVLIPKSEDISKGSNQPGFSQLPRKEPEVKGDRVKTTVTLPVLESEEEKLDSLSEKVQPSQESKSLTLDRPEGKAPEGQSITAVPQVANSVDSKKREEVSKEDSTEKEETFKETAVKRVSGGTQGTKKGALQKLYEEGLKKIQEKHSSESGTEEKGLQDSEADNPFKEPQEIPFINYVVKRPQTLKIKVGFESPAIGQDLDTPPSLANTAEKTLPYYLKSQESKVLNVNNSLNKENWYWSGVNEAPSVGRCENNIEYEKSVELGKSIVKIGKESLDKNTAKALQEAEIERRIIQGEIEKQESLEELASKESPKKSLKKLDLSKKVKPPKPDYSNEIREELEPITPDTDQSEIEEILETFSKELKNSDVNEILSGDESRSKRSPPATLRETAFLPSPPIKCNSMPQYNREPLAKASSLPTPVANARDQVIKTTLLRKEARPNSLPLRTNNNGLPNTSLTLENYIERRKMNYPPSGRVSAPLFKEYQSPAYMSGRRSVPVDHERNIILDRGRSLTRMKTPTRADIENVYNGNFQRNQLRTRSLTRDAYKGYPDTKMDVQRQVIYESNIPKPLNNRMASVAGVQLRKNARSPLGTNEHSGKYSASEIEAVFWERLRQKKIKESLREQELLQKTEGGTGNFIRNVPERNTVGPIYQRNGPKVHKEQNGGVYNFQERVQGSQDSLRKPSEKAFQGDPEGKRKKEDKGFSISKIPFFRRKNKSGSKDDSYKRVSEDYEDYQGSQMSNSSPEDPDTFNAGKKAGVDKAELKRSANKGESSPSSMGPVRSLEKQMVPDGENVTLNGSGRNSTATRPLPPLPLPRDMDAGGYGVILRHKESAANSLPNQKGGDYGRAPSGDVHRASPFHESHAKCRSPSRNMGIIHENELYSNSKFREPEMQFAPKYGCRPQTLSDTESGSEAGEIQRILHGVDKRQFSGDEEWGGDGKGRGIPAGDLTGSAAGVRDDEVRRLGRPGTRRDDPRRHTLAGGHQSSSLAKSMDLESPLPRGYPPPSSAMLYDDDPGIMSEAETSSTGFRRGGKQRSSLPVVRTPSKTLERPLGGRGPYRPSPHKSVMLMVDQFPERFIGSGRPTTHSGLVFLQYRNETKRALLPNEITSIDTVKALFVRSFPKQLTMEYLDSPMVKIYIHDSNKDMFYELEDLRSHLRDIRDRSVLRLFEAADINGGAGGAVPGGPGLLGLAAWDQDQMYFSEPEFDSEYQHQHVHKSKNSKSGPHSYYMTHSFPPGQNQGSGSSATLPRGAGSLLRAYSPAVGTVLPSDRMKAITPSGPPPSRRVPPATSTPLGRFYSQERLHSESGYMSSPERGGTRGYPAYAASAGSSYEDPYYAPGYGSRTGSITPVIDEEASDTEGMDDSYHIYGVGVRGSGPAGRAATLRRDFPATAQPFDATRLRVEHMERQLANLTGLVQKALTQTPVAPGPRDYLSVPASRDAYRSSDEPYVRSDVKPPKFGKDKSVSFEKSVSFSDEPPDMNSPKQHSPQHSADSKPAKPAIKSSTLPRTSSQERDRHKPPPPPKPVSLSPGQYDNRLVDNRLVYRDLQLTPEMYNQLRGLQKKAKDLRQEMRTLRRLSTSQAHFIKETIRDTFIKIRAMLLAGGEVSWAIDGDKDRLRLSREEDLYKQEMIRLEKDLTELESTVEELRGNVINRKTRVNMTDVEDMALVLSKSSKTVAELKVRFPSLQEGIKGLLSAEMDKVVREEKFIKEEPERLENALRRCKKLTGTLVTLKRLASVQEQRLPSSTGESRLSPTPAETPPVSVATLPNKATVVPASGVMAASGRDDPPAAQRAENALDALLDELQTFARPPGHPQSPNRPPSIAEIGRRKGSIDSNNTPLTAALPPATSSLRRLHSYPSSSDDSSPPTQSREKPLTGPKPPVPERNADLLSQLTNRRVPPPPPPRTSSRSPLASPTSPSLPPRSTPPTQPQMGVNTGTLRRNASGRASLRDPAKDSTLEDNAPTPQTAPEPTSNSSSCESVSSQEPVKTKESRKEQLEQRHQELLRKQKALQEQYARLQQLQRGATALSIPPHELMLKKTGSESNLLSKMGLGQSLSAAAPMSGSLTHLASQNQVSLTLFTSPGTAGGSGTGATTANPSSTTSTTKIYETDIL